MDIIDHVAVQVNDINESIKWYRDKFDCDVIYQDESWAELQFDNVRLALVGHRLHPPHIAILSAHPEFYGKIEHHRDDVDSSYVRDPDGNSVEYMEIVESK